MDTLMQNPDRIPPTELETNNLFGSALKTDVPFMASISALNKPTNVIDWSVDTNFSMSSPQTEEMFKAYGVDTIDDRHTRFSASNYGQLQTQLDTYKAYQEADKQLNEAGFIPATLAHLGAGAIDLGTLALGGFIGGVTTKAITSFAGIESTALATLAGATSSAVAAGVSAGITEYATEKLAYNYDPERVLSVVEGAGLLGFGVGGLTTMLQHNTSIKATNNVLKGINDVADPTKANVEFISPLGKLGFGVDEQLLNGHSAYRNAALEVTNTTMAVRDIDTKETIVQRGANGTRIKEQALGYKSGSFEGGNDILYREKYSGKSVEEFLHEQGQTATRYANTVERDASNMYISEIKSDADRIAVIKKETGETILPNEGEVAKQQTNLEQLKTSYAGEVVNTAKAYKELIALKETSHKEQSTILSNTLEKEKQQLANKLAIDYSTKVAEQKKVIEASQKFKGAYTEKEIEKLNAAKNKLDSLTTRDINKEIENIKKVSPEELLNIKKQADIKVKELSDNIKQFEKETQRRSAEQKKELTSVEQRIVKANKNITLPDDAESIIMQHFYKRLQGKYVAPEIITPLMKMYKQFGDLATTMKLHGVAGKVSDFYHNRMWSEQAFRQFDNPTLVSKLVEGMKSHVITEHNLKLGTITEQDLMDTATQMVKDIKRSTLQKEFTEVGFTSPAGAGNPTKQRVIRVDTDKVMDLLVHDTSTIANRYADKMAGRLALKQVGIDVGGGSRNLSEAIDKKLLNVEEQALNEGATRKQIISGTDNLRVAYEALLGTRRIVNNPDSVGHQAASMAKLTASSIYGGGFSKSAVVELGAILQRNGLEALRQFVPAHDTILTKLRSGDKQLAQEFMDVHVGSQVLEGARTSRYEMDELKQTHNWYERTLTELNRKQRQITGFNHITAISENMVALSFFKELKTLSDKGGIISTTDKYRLSRYGIGDEEILAFKDKAEITYDKTGKNMVSINWDSWKDQEFAQAIKFATNDAVRDTILRGDTLHLPKMATDVNSDILSLLFQFKHYPLEATNRLLLGGLSENPAGVMGGMIASMGIAASVTKLVDEAQYRLGITDKRLEDTELFKLAFDKSSQSGVIPNLIGIGASASGNDKYRQKDITKSVFGAGGSVINSSWMLYDKMMRHEVLTDKDKDKITQLVPFSHIPIVNELIRSTVRHNF